MLAKGADIEVADKWGWRALTRAASRGHVDTGKVLLAQGALVEGRNNNGATALMVAAANGHSDFCRLLLAAGADAGALDYRGTSAALQAMSSGHAETAAVLFGLASLELNDLTSIQKTATEPLRRRIEAAILLGDLHQAAGRPSDAQGEWSWAFVTAKGADWPTRGLALPAGSRLTDPSDALVTMDIAKNADIQRERVGIFREQFQHDHATGMTLGEEISVLARYEAMLGRLDSALALAEECLTLAPELHDANLNAAHVFLLAGHFERALPLYQYAARGYSYNNRPRCEAIWEDFLLMRRQGCDCPDMARVEALLNLAPS